MSRLRSGAGVPGGAAVVVALATTTGVAAETLQSNQPAEVVVTAGRLVPALKGATVMPRTEIRPGDSVADALSTLPDLEVNRAGSRGGFATLYMRGADPNFTSVLFEGVPLNDPTNTRGGGYNVSELGTSDLDRIEVVRGSLTAIYGSGALAGAINLIAPRPTSTPRWTAAASGGTFGDHSASVGVAGPLLGTIGGYVSTSLENGGRPIGGGRFSSQGGTLKLASTKVEPDDPSGLVLRFSHNVAHTFPDGSGGPRYAVSRELERRSSDNFLAAFRKRTSLTTGLQLELSVSASHRTEDDDTPRGVPGKLFPTGIPAITSSNHFTRLLGQAFLKTDARRPLSGLIGVEVQRERGSSEGALDFGRFSLPDSFRLSRSTTALFAEGAARTGTLTLDATMRLDHPTDIGWEGSWRTSANWAVGNTGVALHAIADHGFKAPSFYALGNPLYGDPTLKSETSRGLEGGISAPLGGGATLALSGFRRRYTNLIDFVSMPVPRLANRARVVTQGGTASLVVIAPGRTTLKVDAAYVDAHDQETGERLLQRPRWKGSAVVDWQVGPDWHARVWGRWAGNRRDQSNPTGAVTLPAYATVDLQLNHVIGEGLTLAATAGNVLNKRYDEAVGFRAPRANLRVALRKDF